MGKIHVFLFFIDSRSAIESLNSPSPMIENIINECKELLLVMNKEGCSVKFVDSCTCGNTS